MRAIAGLGKGHAHLFAIAFAMSCLVALAAAPAIVVTKSQRTIGEARSIQADLSEGFLLSDDPTQNVITTMAGTGTTGFSGDNGPAISAKLYYPYDVAADASGNTYLIDWNNQRIRKVTPDGVITTVAGNGTIGFSGDGGAATSAQLYAPNGVGVDATGNLVIADTNNHRIRKVALSGIITTIAGTGSAGFS
ncbi:MAG: hypothetical protein DMG14_08550, partial [Acidobacteria bacterium]